jgi:hypothetical protein
MTDQWVDLQLFDAYAALWAHERLRLGSPCW